MHDEEADGGEACAAAAALDARGVSGVCGAPLYELRDLAWIGDVQRITILAAALLDATGRAERAEAEVERLKAETVAMTGTTRDREVDMLIESLFNIDSELEVTRIVLVAADALADAATAPADDDTQARVDAYRLARAEVKS